MSLKSQHALLSAPCFNLISGCSTADGRRPLLLLLLLLLLLRVVVGVYIGGGMGGGGMHCAGGAGDESGVLPVLLACRMALGKSFQL